MSSSNSSLDEEDAYGTIDNSALESSLTNCSGLNADTFECNADSLYKPTFPRVTNPFEVDTLMTSWLSGVFDAPLDFFDTNAMGLLQLN